MAVLKFSSEAEWLTLREAHVGGSDVASLFNLWRLPDGSVVTLHCYEAPPEGSEFIECLSTYKSTFRLWQEKAGKLASDFQENERVQAGKHMEPALAAWAMEKWPDMKMRKVRRYLQHDEHPGWGASLDYEMATGDMEPVEFKNVDFLIFRDKWGGEGEDIIPPIHINLQLQSQIGVKPKATGGWVIVCVGGNTLKRVWIERHEPTQERIGEAVDMFWTGVKAGAEPRWLADFDTVKDLLSNGDGKLPPVDLEPSPAACVDARRYMRWKRHFDYVKGHMDRSKARVALEMGEATKAFGPGFTITWPVSGRIAKMIPEKWQDAATWRGGFTVKPPKE